MFVVPFPDDMVNVFHCTFCHTIVVMHTSEWVMISAVMNRPLYCPSCKVYGYDNILELFDQRKPTGVHVNRGEGEAAMKRLLESECYDNDNQDQEEKNS
jgi:hypothetical protein